MYNLKDDISILTTIPVPALTKLEEKVAMCICHDVEESVLEGQSITDIEIGIGNIQILADGNEVKYRFVPTKKFDNAVKRTITEQCSPLTRTVESTLAKRITTIYKDYI